jgi:SagB-type dehydrogenase family enzyme
VPDAPDAVVRYHDGTKHHFHRFAQSLGYLDWASQPAPFRSFAGSRSFPLFPAPDAVDGGYTPRAVSYDRLFESVAAPPPLGSQAVGDLLRHALGLSAWKAVRGERTVTRWSLRCNPSSGNLHPTEAYLVCGALPGLLDAPAVYHYAADRHALELRCAMDERPWADAAGHRDDLLIVALSSIHWRESWKYGERAFRYCQHDLGHAVAALVAAAAAVGWSVRLMSAWSQPDIAALVGLDRDEDFVDAEREEPACLLAIGSGDLPGPLAGAASGLVAAAKQGTWFGRANQLSEDHVEWTFIDEIAAATRDAGRAAPATHSFRSAQKGSAGGVGRSSHGATGATLNVAAHRPSIDARALMRQRRSAVAFDAASSIGRDRFVTMLAAVVPENRAPWNALWWRPRVHLVIFVHRVEGIAPGVYLLPRSERAIDALRAAMSPDFLWTREHETLPLICLAKGDCRRLAERLSCDQAIASDGFFSLGMVAEFDAGLAECGPSFYRHLFWETGVIGQMLYLEAEAAAARATGIGCFYDDPVHDALGLRNREFQSLYHFTVGIAVEDTRLTTSPGYAWEARG